MLTDLAAGARFLAHLPRFLRCPLTVAEARRIVHQRLETRQADFLALVTRHVYGRASSPYRRLLQLAGCDLDAVLADEPGEILAAGLCQVALDAGIDLSGARFTMGGEPTTAARLAVVRKVGAEGLPLYSSMDSGLIGYGCRRPGAADDCHLLHDFHAAIQPGDDGPARGLPPRALLLSSLRDTAPYLLLNVSLGDRAVMASRACACPLEQEGWPVHLQDVRSFEKLTAAGMTFLDVDLVRVLEEVLPDHFGGGPTDYQVVEEESASGRPPLRLLVHPRVGAVDPDLVAGAFLGAISVGSGAERVMGLNWRATGMLRVEQRPPIRTGVGKILHLHVGAGVGESSP